jgi:type VI protein secretion system component VasF
MYPARLLVGWATAFARRRPQRRWLVVRFGAGAALVAALGLYLFLLFFTPAISAFGRRVLLDHHALLLPTPF